MNGSSTQQAMLLFVHRNHLPLLGHVALKHGYLEGESTLKYLKMQPLSLFSNNETS